MWDTRAMSNLFESILPAGGAVMSDTRAMSNLFESILPAGGTVPIDNRYSLVKEEEVWVVFVEGSPVLDFDPADTAARDLAIVQVCEHGGISEEDASRAFGVSRSTVSRAKRKYVQGGVGALLPRRRGPKGPTKLKGGKQIAMVRLAREGKSQAEIARRLGVSETAVGRALKRLGLGGLVGRQGRLELDIPATEASDEHHSEEASAESEEASADAEAGCVEGSCEVPHEPEVIEQEPVVEEAAQVGDGDREGGEEDVDGQAQEPVTEKQGCGEAVAQEAALSGAGSLRKPPDAELPAEHTLDSDPDNRVIDRTLAPAGQLEDAAPLFGTHQSVARAGLLLVIPILVVQHVFVDAMGIFDQIGPAFYGLRTTVTSLFLLFLSRIRRPESLKEHPPWPLGYVLGLDRFPEMKTLRRKIRRLAEQSRSLQFMKSLAERYLQRTKDTHLWLYLDGHVSVYSGKRKLKKEHVTRLRMSLPAVLDYWINDGRGEPLMVVTAVEKKGMTTLLPKLIADLRKQGEMRPISVVFDREGWSPQMFAVLDEMEGVRFLTYRKAKAKKGLPRVRLKEFKSYRRKVDGKWVDYSLSDKGIYVDYGRRPNRKRLHMRQITRRSPNGHQTHIVTNDWETDAFTLAYRMFSRWGQENFFKYMRYEMDLDGLYTYTMEDADGERMVKNPKRKPLSKRIQRVKKELDELKKEYGDRALNNEEKRRKTMRGFKIANGPLAKQIQEVSAKLTKLEERHAALPAMVPVKVTLKGEEPKQVHVETRRLLHCFRIAAYRAESALRELVRPHYRQWRQDGRTIIQSMMQSSGDLEVTETELRVLLDPQSAPHRTRALARLCEDLNKLNTRFPGSHLRMRFAVREAEDVS